MPTPSIGSYGGALDLKIRQGATFRATITLQNPDLSPINLTGCTIRGQIRKLALDTAITATLDVVIISAPAGQISIGLTDTVTAAIPAGEQLNAAASKYVWDLEMLDAASNVVPLLYGNVTVFREVTR